MSVIIAVDDQPDVDLRLSLLALTAEIRPFRFRYVDEHTGECDRICVQGSDISTAKANIEDILSGSMSDFDLCGINETKILDVFTL